MGIADLRRDYKLGALDRADLAVDPMVQFEEWFAAAGTSIEPNAMTLATADANGRPSARTVLLKGFDARGFTFYTNYHSRKGQELTANPWASLVFHWTHLERQVCIAGSVTQLSREESESYFHTRPRGSQVAAIASEQSSVLSNREELEAKFRQVEEEFASIDPVMPAHWGGYLLKPDRIEFWQGRPSRMHDRFRYLRMSDATWQLDRLSP